MNNRIGLTDTGMSAATKMAEGNFGALRVVAHLMEYGGKIDPDNLMGGVGVLLNLDSFGIYGSRIWMLYKDVCGEDYTRMVAVLRGAQFGMVSPSQLDYAMDNRGRGLDVDDVVAKVRERLPNFGQQS